VVLRDLPSIPLHAPHLQPSSPSLLSMHPPLSCNYSPPHPTPPTPTPQTPYSLMFGPDVCADTKKVHVIIARDGVNHESSNTTAPITDSLTHVYTLAILKNNTYQVYVDWVLRREASLYEDFAMVAPPKIPVRGWPAWVAACMCVCVRACMPVCVCVSVMAPATRPHPNPNPPQKMQDASVEQPADWDDREEIPDASATKPDYWNEETSGEWTPPKISNPDYKGELTGCDKNAMGLCKRFDMLISLVERARTHSHTHTHTHTHSHTHTQVHGRPRSLTTPTLRRSPTFMCWGSPLHTWALSSGRCVCACRACFELWHVIVRVSCMLCPGMSRRVVDTPQVCQETLHVHLDFEGMLSQPRTPRYTAACLQVKSGSLFDNILITDDINYAHQFALSTWGKGKKHEEEMHDEIMAERRKEEEANRPAGGVSVCVCVSVSV
jgi:hypothetical protein